MNTHIDPILFLKEFWPNVILYDKQIEILYSIQDNKETIVPAAHQLGKDFIAAYAVLWFFLTRNPVRIITTSVKDDHLRVLWGEVGRFIDTCKYPLRHTEGGPLIVNHREIKKVVKGTVDKISYMLGMVSEKGEGLTGHHAEHTLLVVDEASGVENMVWDKADSWAKKMFTFGNPYPCSNYFYKSVTEGDVKADTNNHYLRKIIKIKAEDSPNIQLARAEIEAGVELSNDELIPGVVTYPQLQERLILWDDVKQCVAIHGEFYVGPDSFMYPAIWLNIAEEIADKLTPRRTSRKVLGIDPGEGGADTCWVIIDKFGMVDLLSKRTPDTAVIQDTTLHFMKKYSIKPEDVLFDRGGGGKQIADQIRRKGYKVRTVAFGESVNPEKKVGTTPLSIRKDQAEEHYIYKNRRAEMYHLLRLQIDPTENKRGFGIPSEYKELRRQLSPVPLDYDGEGRIKLPPKNRRDPNSKEKTMIDLVGCSPDQSDALVLANYGMMVKSRLVTVGALR
jgi:hypothetical protein